MVRVNSASSVTASRPEKTVSSIQNRRPLRSIHRLEVECSAPMTPEAAGCGMPLQPSRPRLGIIVPHRPALAGTVLHRQRRMNPEGGFPARAQNRHRHRLGEKMRRQVTAPDDTDRMRVIARQREQVAGFGPCPYRQLKRLMQGVNIPRQSGRHPEADFRQSRLPLVRKRLLFQAGDNARSAWPLPELAVQSSAPIGPGLLTRA